MLADKPVQGHFGAADAGSYLPASRHLLSVNCYFGYAKCTKDATTARLLEERLRAAGNPDATIFVYVAWCHSFYYPAEKDNF